MAYVKFDINRMKEVHARIDSLKDNLRVELSKSTAALDLIGMSLTENDVHGYIHKYTVRSSDFCNVIISNLVKMQDYLQSIIGNSETTEKSTVDSLDDISAELRNYMSENNVNRTNG